MTDITMCSNHGCPKSKDCYRHEAKPSQWQSYASFSYTTHQAGAYCADYLPLYEHKSDKVVSVRK